MCPGPIARATRTAAATLIPAEPPTDSPSWISRSYTCSSASASPIRSASSIGAPARFSGTRLCPIPSVIELPATLKSPFFTQPYSPLPSGSASTIRTFASRSFSASATPASVPPVPQAQVKASIFPPVCAQISGPVVARCPSRLARLSNWFAHTPPISSASRFETCT